jgi:hypothetical protein
MRGEVWTVPSSCVTLLQFAELTLLVFCCNVQPIEGDDHMTATVLVVVRKMESRGLAGIRKPLFVPLFSIEVKLLPSYSAAGSIPGQLPSNSVMKTTLHVMALALAVYLAGCRTPPATCSHAACYEYVAQVLAMPSCAAKVEETGPCYARLSTEAGGVLYVGSPGASPEVVGFIHTLQKGQTYFLPDAFMEYQQKQEKGPIKADADDGK